MNESLDTGIEPNYPEIERDRPRTVKGGLYQETVAVSLFGDQRAYRPGDVLTVVLQEMTRSSKRSNTSIGKESELDIPAPTVFGQQPNSLLGTSLIANRNFGGKAITAQQNLLTGSVTVVVQSVLESGALRVKGSKLVRLNQGDEIIYVSGIVRPEDVSQDNQVLSSRLADARISYTAKGDFANANSMGWLTRIFNSNWFPF